MLFGKEQGTNYNTSVISIDEVKMFDTEEKALDYGEQVINNGGDSYFIYEEGENIKWRNKTKSLFNKLLRKAKN